jgi:hypothetical protein
MALCSKVSILNKILSVQALSERQGPAIGLYTDEGLFGIIGWFAGLPAKFHASFKLTIELGCFC